MSCLFRQALIPHALATATALGCASSQPARDAGSMQRRVVRWSSLLCTPAVDDVDVSVQDAPMGTRIVLESSSQSTAEALRASLWGHAQPVEKVPAPEFVLTAHALPGNTRVRIENLRHGAAVTYMGTTALERRSIRAVLGPIGRELRFGECTMLQAIAWAPASGTDLREP